MLSTQEKTIAVTAHLTFVGLIIAFFMNSDLKSKFATSHIKNMFGLVILWFIGVVFVHYIVEIIGLVLLLIAIIIWMISIIHAVLGKIYTIPYFTVNFQKWFRFLE